MALVSEKILATLKSEIEYREKVNDVSVKQYGALDPVSCQTQGAVTEAKRVYIKIAQLLNKEDAQ